MTADVDALGRCTVCGKTYAVFKDEENWRALGTDGNCSCGNDEFTLLSDPRSEGEASPVGET